MPKVSVILPVYNPGSYLRPALESVIAQTYDDWELIVIDDGSPGDVLWVEGFHPKVTLVRQTNRGVSSARNFGIDRSSGALIAFLDHDDIWMAHKLAQQVDIMDARPEAVFCHSQMEFIDAAGKAGGLGWGGGYETYEELLAGCGVCLSSVLIRRDILFVSGLFDPLCRYSQDYDLWLKAARLGPMIALATPLVWYRLHSSNLSNDYEGTWGEVTEILRRHRHRALIEGRLDIVAKCDGGIRLTTRSTAQQAVNRAWESLRARNLPLALRHTMQAARFSPLGALDLATRRLRARFTRADEPRRTLPSSAPQ